MNTYLYRIQPARIEMLKDGSTEEEDRIIGEHFKYLSRLHDRGVVWMAGRTLTTDLSSFGIVIIQVEDEASADKLMKADPAVKLGVMKADLFPFKIAIS